MVRFVIMPSLEGEKMTRFNPSNKASLTSQLRVVITSLTEVKKSKFWARKLS